MAILLALSAGTGCSASIRQLAREAGRGTAEGALGRADSKAARAIRREAELLAESIAQATMAGMAKGIDRELGPAVERMLREHVRAAIEDSLDDKMNQTLGRTARVIGREATIGQMAALRATRVAETAKRGIQLGEVIAGVLALILVALIAWTVRSTLRVRRERAEMQRQASAIRLVAEAIRSAEDREWAPELREVLKETLHDRAEAELFWELLSARTDGAIRRHVARTAEEPRPPTEH
ncbi:MAG: hypothetical protein HYY06_02770 [Deltaproteobacteria bacterium]|nr:hypothetical protein [Deltaproteobacteria bacterium]